jgi:hypothetical protein
MNKVAFLCAIALMSIARSSAAQQCPPAQFGQPCTGGSVGTCVASTCSSEADDGAVTDQPCGFCEAVECSIAAAGQACDGGGSCAKGTCEGTDDAGMASSRACAVCVLPPSDECTANNVGKPCDGGVCISNDGKARGPAGAGPSSQVVYPQWTCQIFIDASGPLAELDASVGVPHGGTSAGMSPADAATPPPAALPTSKGSSGCAISGPSSPSGSTLYLGTGAVVLAWRRRRSKALRSSST